MVGDVDDDGVLGHAVVVEGPEQARELLVDGRDRLAAETLSWRQTDGIPTHI